MSRSLRIALAVSVGLALVVPAAGVAQDPPPDEVAPPPPTTTTPQDPIVQIEPPPTVTITVPPLPEPTPAPRKAKAQRAKPEPVRRSSPTRSAPVSEPEPVAVAPSSEDETPVEEPTPARPAAVKPKPHRKKVQRPKPRVVATATAPPVRTIRDPDRAGAVLAAQFTLGDQGESQGIDTTVVAFAIVLAALLGSVVGVVGAAPLLAERWPKVFEPVIDATERIVLVGVCLAGGALTLAATWVLTRTVS